MRPATVVLADDHQVVRAGLRLLLEGQPGLTVVGETSDGLQVADLVERLNPDVLVADLIMPGLGGLDVTREVKRRSPKTRIVILSMHSSDAFVLQALRNGASAYVLKSSSADDLVQAIHEVLAGRRYLSPPLSDKAIAAYVKRAEAGEVDIYETLTTREREVLHLAAEGHPIVGDEKYGDFTLNKALQRADAPVPLRRMFLHAWRLQFNHPVAGRRMHLQAELPAELQTFLDHATGPRP